jgi:CHAD domain-containing protein
MRLDPELLDDAPAVAARIVVLARCADAEEAAARLADLADVEALHDLRVALRRLRSTLRALRPLLGGAVGEKPLRRLRKAARLTGPARDDEVLLDWLGAARPRLQAPYRGALDWLTERVDHRRRLGHAAVAERAVPRLLRATSRIARALAGPLPPAVAGAPATFAEALAGLLRSQAAALREALRGVAGPQDVAAIHGARIEGKRLRYLLEPLRGVEGADAAGAVKALKGLQDLLGEWHDAHAFEAALAGARLEAAAERARWRERGAGDADLRPGLLALERLAAGLAAERYGQLAERHLGGRATPLLDEVFAVVAALEGLGGDAEAAPERRLLLTGLPPEVAQGEAEELEQGWLPGDRARESVGVVRADGGERWFRAVASRRHGRAPHVEPLGRAAFDALWPLTEGRRIARRSRRAPGAPAWRIDEHLDRRLVLAVAEPGGDAPPPGWLEPLVVRDVTGERGYADEALARRPPRRAAPGAAAGSA